MKLLIVAGARPNFMKIAPFIHAVDRFNRNGKDAHIRPILVHTGQHYDIRMSEVFFRELAIPEPDYNLGVGSASHAVQTAGIMVKFEPVCLSEKPDWVIVVGDVNSTMACTLVASKLGIKVAHIEAGLRSYDRTMPEEINRIVTDALADLLFTSSPDADENLIREGVEPEKIKFVGNIMIDTLLENLDSAKGKRVSERFGLKSKDYALVTLHRSGNTDDDEKLVNICRKLTEISRLLPLIFPIHPRTQAKLRETPDLRDFATTGNIKIIEPLGYTDFQSLLFHAKLVITDSGGLQEETTALGIPCLTLRPNTERPVTITVGTNKLITLENLEKEINLVRFGRHKKGAVPEFWDGKTAGRILDVLLDAGMASGKGGSMALTH